MGKIKRIVSAIALTTLCSGILSAQELEEVIVTATKTAKDVNDISVTVDVFGDEELKDNGINQVEDLAQFTPGLNIKPSVGDQNPIITVRGIGFNDFTSIQNPGTGVYVDQVIVPYSPMMSFQMLDLERVEVLKGPQGTLYGRNTTAGAVNFVSIKPSEEFSANAGLEISSWDTTNFDFAVGGGMTDNLSTRFAFNQYTRNDSYMKDRVHPNSDIGNKDRNAYRLSFLFDNDENFDALLNIHGGNDNSANVALEHIATFDPLLGVEPCAAVLAGIRGDEAGCTNIFGYFDNDGDPFTGDYSIENGGIDNDAFGVGLTMNWSVGDSMAFTSVTGYDKFNRLQIDDFDAAPTRSIDVTFDDTTKSFSQEFRLSGGSEKLSWITGFFYSDDSIQANQIIDGTDFTGAILGIIFDETVNAYIINNQDSTALAFYGNATYSLSDQVNLLFGLRYTDEDKEWNGGTTWAAIGIENHAVKKISNTDVSGQLGIEFRPNDDWLWYGTFSKGFRSGGFPGGFTTQPEQLEAFDPEIVYAYEAGFKARLADNSMQLNAAAYYYDWQDFQTQFTEVRGSLISLFLTNAGDAAIKGLEVSLDWAATEAFNIHGGFNLMDSNVSSTDPRLDDKQLANAPELTYSLMADYTVDMSSGYKLVFAGDVSYTDDVFYTSDNFPVFKGANYTLANARVKLVAPSEHWDISLWGRNLADKIYRVNGFNQIGASGDSYFTYGEPRSYGIGFRYYWF